MDSRDQNESSIIDLSNAFLFIFQETLLWRYPTFIFFGLSPNFANLSRLIGVNLIFKQKIQLKLAQHFGLFSDPVYKDLTELIKFLFGCFNQ